MPLVKEPIRGEPDRFRVLLHDYYQGVDTYSSDVGLTGTRTAEMQNMDVPGRVPTVIGGASLHATSMVAPDSAATVFLARYTPASGTATYLIQSAAGIVYTWSGSAWIEERQGLSTTSGLWASTVSLADYLITSNPSDGNFKWDGSNYLPIGAKIICDMDSSEDSDWTNGSTEATTYREGVQSRSTGTLDGSANADITMTFNPSGTQDLHTGILQAKNYSTTSTDHATAIATFNFQLNLSNATNFNDTGTDSYLRVQTTAGSAYLQFDADTWGTLANGWNAVSLTVSAGDETGTFNLSSVDSVVFEIQSQTGDLIAIIDDCYINYSTTIPTGQVNTQFKNMLLVGNVTGTGGLNEVHYSKVSAPDEYEADATLPIASDDGSQISLLHPFFDQILVGKQESSLHTLGVELEATTYPSYRWTTRRVKFADHGASSQRAVVEANNRLYIYYKGAIYLFEGITSAKISYPVTDTLNDIQVSLLDEAVMAKLENENIFYLWWPASGASTNTKSTCYDYVNDAWLPLSGQTMAQAVQVHESGTEYVLTVDEGGRVLRQNSGTNLDGSTLTAYFRTPWISGMDPFEKTSWEELYALFTSTTTGTLTIQYRLADHPTDFDTASFATLSTYAVGSDLGRLVIGFNSNWIQLSFQTAGVPFSLHWPIILYGSQTGLMQ